MNADRDRVRWAVAALAIAGALTHFIGLGYPRQVVFDEATFGKYVAAYCCTGERIFDVHPPHGKLLIAAAAKIGGFDGRFSFERIGLPRERILHVAQSLYHDHVTAKRLGLSTVWIDRRHGRPGSGATPPANATPDATYPDMASFAEAATAAR